MYYSHKGAKEQPITQKRPDGVLPDVCTEGVNTKSLGDNPSALNPSNAVLALS